MKQTHLKIAVGTTEEAVDHLLMNRRVKSAHRFAQTAATPNLQEERDILENSRPLNLDTLPLVR